MHQVVLEVSVRAKSSSAKARAAILGDEIE